MIHVIAILQAVPGQRDALLGEIRANIPAVRAEDGCLQYEATIDAADPAKGWATFGPDTVVVVERWASRAALQAHAVAPHMVAYGARAKPLLAARAVHVLDPVGA